MADKKEKKPTHLIAQDPDTWAKPPDISWGDYSFNPEKPLTPRAKKLCHLIASGWKQGEAAAKVGYSLGWASRICTSTKGKNEILRFQDKVFEQSVAERVKDLGNPALDVIEDVLKSEDSAVKPQLKVQAAMWVAEKISGKAKQEVEHTGNILHEFVDKLKLLEESGQVLDVTPLKEGRAGEAEGESEVTERDKLDQFLDFDAHDLE